MTDYCVFFVAVVRTVTATEIDCIDPNPNPNFAVGDVIGTPRSVMGGAGTAMMGIGRGSGKNRAQESAEGAIMSALLDVPITGAQGIVFNVLGGNDMSLQEVRARAFGGA